MGKASNSKGDSDSPAKASSSPYKQSHTFIHNAPNRPKVIVVYDVNVKLALVQLKNGQGKAVQFVGKLPSAEEDFVGTKKEKHGDGAVSEKNGDYTNFQRVFVYPYQDKEGSLKDILTEAGNKFKSVSVFHLLCV